MLSRTADNLYWLGRYVERVENTARLLAGTQRLSLMPIPKDEQGICGGTFFKATLNARRLKRNTKSTEENAVIEFMALDRNNPRASVPVCSVRVRTFVAHGTC